jgi:spore germination cell wall hydrolase CwlJ-like protein
MRGVHATFQDVDVLTRTIYGEARGEDQLGKVAVAWVVRNRHESSVTWWGEGIAGVCTAPWQFSCWNRSDPNRELIETLEPTHGSAWDCLRAAVDVLGGAQPDPTQGATHYHHQSIEPPWAKDKKPCAVIGEHLFYNDVG